VDTRDSRPPSGRAPGWTRSDQLEVVFGQWKKKLPDQTFVWPMNGAKSVYAVGLARGHVIQDQPTIPAIMYVQTRFSLIHLNPKYSVQFPYGNQIQRGHYPIIVYTFNPITWADTAHIPSQTLRSSNICTHCTPEEARVTRCQLEPGLRDVNRQGWGPTAELRTSRLNRHARCRRQPDRSPRGVGTAPAHPAGHRTQQSPRHCAPRRWPRPCEPQPR
jgi:hypothetical protein